MKYYPYQKISNYYNQIKPLLFNYITLFITGVVSLTITSQISFHFSPNDINYYEQTLSIAAILTTICIWGFDSSALIDEAKKKKKNYTSIILMLWINLFLTTILIFGFDKYFIFFENFNLLVLIILSNMTFSSISKMMTLSGHMFFVNISNIVFALVRVSIIFILIYFFDKNVDYWLYSLVISNLFGIISIFYLCRNLLFNKVYNLNIFLKKYLNYIQIGLILIIPELFSVLSEKFGRIYVSFQYNSIEGAAYQLAQTTSLVILSLNIGYSRFFESKLISSVKKIGILAYIKSHLFTYFSFCFIGVVFCLFFWKFFVDSNYSSGIYNTSVLLILCLVYILDGIVKFYLLGLKYYREYKIMAFFMTTFLFIYVILSIILTKLFSVIGIAFALLISNFVFLILLHNKLKNEPKRS